jgi:Squalene-hopene cyclase C-terminal domain/Ankyrin repeats (3 copies)/Ankyrin repeat
MKITRLLLLLIAAAATSFAQPNFTPPTPLYRAVMRNDTAGAKVLLEQGANPNEGRLAGFPPLFFPVLNQNLELFRAMVAKDADINAKDGSGSTLLMWAAFDEEGRTTLLEELLRIGMDPNAKNLKGETALTWALRRGDTRVVRFLRQSGMTNTDDVKTAARNAIAILEKAGPQFIKVSGCTSCHHQSLPQMAFGVARSHGFATDDSTRQQQVKMVLGQFRPLQEAMEHETEAVPNPELSVSYALLGLAVTSAMAHLVASRQRSDGSFRPVGARPPLESSDFTATALSLRSLQLYGTEEPGRIQRAAEWLRSTTPKSTEDRAMQLLGMHWANSSKDATRIMGQTLLREQRSDGGWSQLPGLETDAYATGQALVALRRAGVIDNADPAYQRGVDYLMRTQMSDGSWLVRTRSYPVQPYKDSGFPHGKNQWISASGTSWALMALSLSIPSDDQASEEPLSW